MFIIESWKSSEPAPDSPHILRLLPRSSASAVATIADETLLSIESRSGQDDKGRERSYLSDNHRTAIDGSFSPSRRTVRRPCGTL